MSTALPDPPASLAGAARAFYEELRRMLAVVQPTQIELGQSSTKFDRKGVEVELVHANRKEWTIWATVGDDDAIVSTSWAHEHFFNPTHEEAEDRPWTTETVDFIAEILRGQIVVETTYRGTTALSVRHYNLDEGGNKHSLGYTAFLTPTRLLVWRPKRIESERASWL